MGDQATSPLAGRQVLITRSQGGNRALAQALLARGAHPIDLPTLAFAPPEDPTPLRDALRHLSRFGWLAVTSARGAQAVLDELQNLGLGLEALSGVKLACVGKATAAALEQRGRRADLIPQTSTAAALAQALLERSDKAPRVLAALAQAARPDLVEGLRQGGADVVEVCAYRTVTPAPDPEALRRLLSGQVEAALFASPSALQALGQMVAPRALGELLAPLRVVCIGEVTAEAARGAGVRVDIVPPGRASVLGMVDALAQSWEEPWPTES